MTSSELLLAELRGEDRYREKMRAILDPAGRYARMSVEKIAETLRDESRAAWASAERHATETRALREELRVLRGDSVPQPVDYADGNWSDGSTRLT